MILLFEDYKTINFACSPTITRPIIDLIDNEDVV